MVSTGGGIVIAIVILLLAAAVGWVVFTQLRARKLGVSRLLFLIPVTKSMLDKDPSVPWNTQWLTKSPTAATSIAILVPTVEETCRNAVRATTTCTGRRARLVQ